MKPIKPTSNPTHHRQGLLNRLLKKAVAIFERFRRKLLPVVGLPSTAELNFRLCPLTVENVHKFVFTDEATKLVARQARPEPPPYPHHWASPPPWSPAVKKTAAVSIVRVFQSEPSPPQGAENCAVLIKVVNTDEPSAVYVFSGDPPSPLDREFECLRAAARIWTQTHWRDARGKWRAHSTYGRTNY